MYPFNIYIIIIIKGGIKMLYKGKEYDDNQILEILNITFAVIFIPVNIQKMKFVVLK